MPTLDATDRKILAVLEAEGRISIVELAAQVGLSPTPCQRRVKRLEADGVIRGYAARLDPKAMGRGFQAFVLVNLANHGEETVAAFQEAVRARPEVVGAYALSGEFDYLLHVTAPDLEAFSAFALKALLRLPGVRDTRSSFALSTLK
ncbi:MAG: Lrp/AsnC family transcriptional regulator [Alphaproteobacteria bacterium]